MYNRLMNFEALVRSRRSVRAYDSTVVPEAALGACLEAARLAPSACNAQPWHFVVVREAQARGVLARASVPPVGGMNRFVAEYCFAGGRSTQEQAVLLDRYWDCRRAFLFAGGRAGTGHLHDWVVR